jgi:protease-4
MKNSTKWLLIILGIILAVGFFFSIIVFVFIAMIGKDNIETVTEGGRGEKIAVVELTGTIISSDEVVRQLKKYAKDHSIRAILFRVDSPGGGVVASHEIYEEIRSIVKGGKPVVVSMGALAASGGYYVSCGATKIVANPGTLTGSIGVISQFMRVDSLLHKIGIEATTIKSGRMKDAGTPFRAMTPEDKAYFQDLMDNVHHQFIAIVEKERKLNHDTLVKYADGRVFTGEQAKKLGLVDTLGTFNDAVAIAAHSANIWGEPTLVRERKRSFSMLDWLLDQSKVSELTNLKDEFLRQPVLQYKMTFGM